MLNSKNDPNRNSLASQRLLLWHTSHIYILSASSSP